MSLRPVFVLLTLFGAAGALVLGTLETAAGDTYWQARPGLDGVGPTVIIASLVSLCAGTVGLVVDRVRDRRTPAVDSPRAALAGTAWAGWVLVGAGAAFAVVLAGALVGLSMIEVGGCADDGSWCGFGTAILAYGAGVAVTVLAAAGGALLGWSGRAAAPAGVSAAAAVRDGRRRP